MSDLTGKLVHLLVCASKYPLRFHEELIPDEILYLTDKKYMKQVSRDVVPETVQWLTPAVAWVDDDTAKWIVSYKTTQPGEVAARQFRRERRQDFFSLLHIAIVVAGFIAGVIAEHGLQIVSFLHSLVH